MGKKKLEALDETIEISKNNLKAVEKKLENSSWLDFLSSKRKQDLVLLFV